MGAQRLPVASVASGCSATDSSDPVAAAPDAPGASGALPATGGGAAVAGLAAVALAVLARNPRLGRRLLLSSGAVAAGVAAASSILPGPAQAQEPDRPNILWFRSEDNSARLLGAYGNEVANTPTIDQFARDGVLYRNFFTTSPVCAPTKLGWTTGMYEAGMGPGHNMRAMGRRPAFARGFAAWLADAGYWCTTSGNADYNTDFGDDHGYQDDAGDWQSAAAAGQSFFALLGSSTSHETVSFAPVPSATDPSTVDLPAYHPDDPVLRLDRAAYLDRLTMMDTEFANVLAELEDLGVAGNTIVVYSSDHGGVLPRSKRFCYDSGLHTPLIIRFPERWKHLAPGPAGTSVDQVVSSVDCAPTVLRLAGLDVPSHFQGTAFLGDDCAAERQYAFSNRNRMDESLDFVRTVRDTRYRYIRNYMPHLPWGQHVQFMWLQAGVRRWEQLHLDGVLDEVQDRFWQSKPAEEFYDLEADPDEVDNLIDDPGHAARIDQMRQALDEHLLRINDNGFIPEGSDVEGYDESRAPDAYPLRRLMELAARAIERDPAHLPVLVAALGDANGVVRYWGALGCSMLGDAAQPAAEVLGERLADEGEDGWVRVQAADALGRAGDPGGAVPFLASVVADTAAPVRQRLQAVRSLTHLGTDAITAVPELTAAAADPDEYVGNAGRYAVRVVTGTYVPAP